MLHLAYSLEQLAFEHLMELYREGNEENGQYFWPDRSPQEQVRLAQEEFYRYLKKHFFSQESVVYALWKSDSIYVSGLRLEPYLDGWLLEALETHPDHRRKGCASRLIQEVQYWLGNGKIYSHVSKSNDASLKTHKHCGFVEFLPYEVENDGKVNPKTVTLCWEASPRDPEE